MEESLQPTFLQPPRRISSASTGGQGADCTAGELLLVGEPPTPSDERGIIIGNPVSELTDSGAGGASAMANPSGSNSKGGTAIRGLVNKAPGVGTNNLLVTHKTNIADAFGKSFSDVKEGEALVYKPDPSGLPKFVGRIIERG
jgi:hypothetical protein